MYVTSPLFTKITFDRDPKKGNAGFSPLSFFEAMKLAFSKRAIIPKEEQGIRKAELTSVVEQSFDHYLGPILVFFECCPTTGKAFISPDKRIVDAIDKNYKKYLRFMVFFCLDYSNNSFSPVNVSENRTWTLLKVMSNPITNFKVKVTRTTDHSNIEGIFDTFYCLGNRMKGLNMSPFVYEEFLDYYESQGKKSLSKRPKRD